MLCFKRRGTVSRWSEARKLVLQTTDRVSGKRPIWTSPLSFCCSLFNQIYVGKHLWKFRTFTVIVRNMYQLFKPRHNLLLDVSVLWWNDTCTSICDWSMFTAMLMLRSLITGSVSKQRDGGWVLTLRSGRGGGDW